MKETAQQSVELKYRFKRHFLVCGYYIPLPLDLARERDEYPLEWAEACQEWEQYGTLE
jgi:hypothetical protein